MSPRPKLRRRGERLIATYPNGAKVTHIGDPKRGVWRVFEVCQPDGWYRVTSSKGDKYFWRKGEYSHKGGPLEPLQLVTVDHLNGVSVAIRSTDDDIWQFCDPDGAKGYNWMTAHDAALLITNAAIIVGLIKRRLPDDLTEFLGVSSPLLVNIDEIEDIRDDPRFALLREFNFRAWNADPDSLSGGGRQAENKARHTASNYDQMLQQAGGLLHPEAYEVVRRGTDRIVRARLKGGTTGTTT